MKYTDKYPHSKASQEVEQNLFLTGSNHACCMCGDETPYFNTTMRDFICGDECRDLAMKLAQQYVKKQ